MHSLFWRRGHVDSKEGPHLGSLPGGCVHPPEVLSAVHTCEKSPFHHSLAPSCTGVVNTWTLSTASSGTHTWWLATPLRGIKDQGHVQEDPLSVSPRASLFRLLGHVDSRVTASSGTLTCSRAAPGLLRAIDTCAKTQCRFPLPPCPGIVKTRTPK